ncbi:MAG: ABC transporter permease [Clostridium sp.]|jgi:oligopeptide transport system permease protein|nr:ABC transporter permease [Clostridium sp.]
MNIDQSNIPKLPEGSFHFVQRDEKIFDRKFDTKPIGYFRDAFNRFSKNKGSVVAAAIIILLLIFAITVPFFSKYTLKDIDVNYSYTLPRSEFFSQFGFWNGYKDVTCNQQQYDAYEAIGCIVQVYDSYEVEDAGRSNTYYDLQVDSYLTTGYRYINVTQDELAAIEAYEVETGLTVLCPMINLKQIKYPGGESDPNLWYKHTTKSRAERDEAGNLVDIYMRDDNGDFVYSLEKMGGSQYQIRVYYYDYYRYLNGFKPSFLLGSDGFGKDILIQLAVGARLSFMLSFCVAAINFIIGTIYGAIEGYYGGWADMIMERVSDILAGVPFIVTAVLFQLHIAKTVGVIGALIFAFILTGWIGTAYRVRTQFYRYKGQEYVLAARTLGAKDFRIIFRHILPNSLGTIVTSCVLMIPGVIITESSLSYLNIIDLSKANLTSIGTLLSNGQGSLSTYPHVIFFPALFISLLMISFNIFGNGLRDAFNPSLRGSEE